MESPESVPRDEVPDLSHDLDSLYERLKLVMQTIQSPDETPEMFREELNHDLKVPLHSETEELKDTSTLCSCKCKEIFTGDSIRFCSVCGDSISVINQILTSKLKFEDEIEGLEEIVNAEREEKNKLLLYNQELEERLESLELELDKRCDKMQSLMTDLNAINAKYIREIEKLSEVQHSKALVEEELEELSRNLFEEANKMVADEARGRNAAEQAKERLEDEVMHLKNQLFVQNNLNRDLKKKLKYATSSFSNLTDTESSQPEDSEGEAFEYPGFSEDDDILDEIQLEQFEAFAASCVDSNMNKILQLSFFKRCLEEDIEPCLKFGESPRIYPSRIVDALIHDSLRILTNEGSPRSSIDSSAASLSMSVSQNDSNSMPSGNNETVTDMWNRWSNAAAQAMSSTNKPSPLPANGCHACGLEAHCKFRLQLVERQEPIPVDKFCRDRIIACLEFFDFINALRTGQYNTRRIDDLYTESLRLRLRMFYARLGFLPSSGIEIPRTLEYSASPAIQLAPVLEEVEASPQFCPNTYGRLR